MTPRHQRVCALSFLAWALPLGACGPLAVERAASSDTVPIDEPPTTLTVPSHLPVLHVGSLGLTSLDSADLTGPGDREIGRLIHRGLTEIGGNGLPEPDIASRWTTSDNQTWRFELEAGHTFHDGEPIEAAAFVTAIDHLLETDAEAEAGYLAEVAGIVRAEAVDPLTVEITLDRPNSLLPLILAEPAFAARSPSGGSVGSGPYRWTRPWDGITELDLVPYDGYLGPVPGHVVSFHFFETVEQMYASEWLDVTTVPEPEIERLRHGPVSDRLLRPPVTAYNYIAFPLAVDGFDDYRIRTALSLAIDRQAIVDGVFGGGKSPATGFTPGRTIGSVPNNCSACKHDLQEARRLFKAGGGIPGDVIELSFNTGNGHEQWVQEVGEQWTEAFGIEVQFRPDGKGPYLDAIEAGLMPGPYRLAWSSDYPHAMSILEPLFIGPNRVTSDFADERLEELATGFHRLEDPYGPEGARTVARMARLLSEQMPIVPVFADISYRLRSERVINIRSLASGVLALEDAILTE